MKTTSYAFTPPNPSEKNFSEVYEIIVNETLELREFNELAIAGSLFSLSVFKGITFRDCVFYGSRFENCTFVDCIFENCTFQFAHVEFCQFAQTTFAHCNWDFASIQKSDFNFCQLDNKTILIAGDDEKGNRMEQCFSFQSPFLMAA